MTQPSNPVPAPRSPDGRWWWDGTQWQPVPEASAPWSTQQPVPGRQSWQPEQAWPVQQQSRRGSSGKTVAIVVGSVVAAVTLLIGGLAALGGATVSRQRERNQQLEVRTALIAAVVAEATYGVDNSTYTTDLEALAGYGLEPQPGIDIRIVSATTDTYCLAAGPAGEAPTFWATELESGLTEPCG